MKKLYHYIVCFTLYAILGWFYEVFLEVVVYQWGFTNRGVLFGPYCPVYGFGALAMVFTVYPMLAKCDKVSDRIKRIPLVFIFCMLIATALELATSYLLELAIGSWPWQTYADYTYNFQARIALSPSIRFGLGGLLFLYVLQPLFERFTNRLGPTRTRILAIVFLVMFAADIVYSFLLK